MYELDKDIILDNIGERLTYFYDTLKTAVNIHDVFEIENEIKFLEDLRSFVAEL